MMTADNRQHLCLIGLPTLAQHLQYIHEHVVNTEHLPKSEQIAIWRKANDYFLTLNNSESGIAEDIEVFNLHTALQPLTSDARSDRHFLNTFNVLPTHFAMVELEKLVVHQTYIDLDESTILKCALHDDPDPVSLLQFCLPDQTNYDAVTVRRIGDNRYTFSCRNSDFHARTPALLDVEQIVGLESPQLIDNILAIGLAHNSGYFSGILFEDRVLLHEGYDKAFAMLSAGVKHAPMILQTASRLDELELVAKEPVLSHPDRFFNTARPPLLKDFLDNNLCRQYELHDTQTVVDINVTIQTYQSRC